MSDNNEIMIVDEKSLKDKIYVIRGQQVMLDFDLAEIYGYSTKAFNQQIKNNIEKFEEDFMFELTREEYDYILRSQFVTLRLDDSNINLRSKNLTSSWGGNRYLPYAFTEQGIYMLMTVLRGEVAIKQSKALIRLFKSMKDYIVNNEYSTKQLLNLTIRQENVENRVESLEKNMIKKSELSKIINLFDTNIKNEEILILNGEPFKADLAYQRIFKKAKKSIYIIDNYIGIKLLEHLKDIKTNMIIFSDNKSKHLTRNELNDFYRQYPNVSINFKRINNLIHDRFIIIDYKTKNETIYYAGSSIKDSGNKLTIINRFENTSLIHPTIDDLLLNEDLII